MTAAPPRRRFQLTMTEWLGLIVLLLFVAGVWGVYYTVTTAGDVAVDAYAVEWTSDCVLEYMKTHEDAWPKTWEDLRPSYKTLTDKVGYEPWSLEHLRERVAIDWNADPRQLAQATEKPDEPPFRVIWLTSGRGVYWADLEPNQSILNYLRTRGSGAATHNDTAADPSSAR